jgi:hypothetical protein|nr:MAG TPA: Oligo alginate lyase [Caudoviricetes sp.]
MPTFTVQASGSTAVAKNHPNTNYSDLTQYKFFVEPFTGDAGNIKRGDNVYINFPVPGDTYKFKRVTKVTLAFYAQPTAESDATYKGIWTYVNALASQFDADAMTYATRPEIYQTFTGVSEQANGNWTDLNEIIQLNAVFDLKNYKSKKEELQQGIRNGFVVALRGGESGTSEAIIFGAKSTRKPSLVCEYSDDTVGITADGFAPTAGAFVNRFEKNMFTWRCDDDTADSQVCFAEIKQTSAVFEWRVKNASASNTISVSGATTACTVPANTFPSGTIEWRVKVTANSGTTTTSAWQEITTTDVTPTAKPVSPSGIVIDATIVNRFSWQHIISTGTPQSKADLQWSADGTTWNTLATVAGENQYYDVPANKFTSGTKYWRVRTYNTDGIAGEWSDAAQIVVIAAPTAPSIQIKSTGPRPSISWQTSEQEAYQVELDGKLSVGTHYGTDKTWTSPAYLADGSHTVRVRVQNQYGMWSDWGAAALPVTNTPGASITLSVQASSVADLNWQTSGSYDFYLVYRNDKPIAKLTQTQYTDELSSGNVIYQVRGCYADSSNYGLSSAVTVTITTGQYVTLYGIASGKKVMLKHCGLKNQPVQNAINRDIQYIFMYGSTYPHAERSEFVTKKVGGTAVFLPGEDKAGFDALIGELVCLKTQSGEMVIGYLNETSDTSRVNPDKSVVNFSIQQIDYAEVIDIDS